MRLFKDILLCCLATGALAQTFDVIKTQFGKIGSALDNLDSSVKSLSESAGSPEVQTKATLAKADLVETALKGAISAIRAAPDKLSIIDAASVTTIANTLISKTDTAITDLIAKKPLIVKYNQGGAVRQHLQSQKVMADDLAIAVTEKVPSVAQSIAKSTAAKVGISMGKALQAFS